MLKAFVLVRELNFEKSPASPCGPAVLTVKIGFDLSDDCGISRE